jgi:hypothetical protein
MNCCNTVLNVHPIEITRVQMLAKMFPRLKVLCQLFMGTTLGFDMKQRNSFLIKLKARF